MADRLVRMFAPRSVVAIGGSWAGNVVRSLQGGQFGGDIWAVHPRKPEVSGVPAVASLSDLPAVPDVAFVGVNRDLTPHILRELRDMGAGGAVCFASGFSEAGADGLQAALREAAGDMPVLGPNCYGILNYFDHVALWPDQHGGVGVDRGVGIISQSSNIAINLTMNARGLPIGKVACLGNAALIGAADLARHMMDDPRITAIGFYLEGFGDAQAFADMAAAARKAGKPLVVLKSGRTRAARAAAASHTAALAGSAVISEAFLRQCGVIEVRDLATLIETLKLVHVTGGLAGNRIATMSCSGGEAGLIADCAQGLPLDFAPFDPVQSAGLKAVLGPLVTIANPLDYHTFIWGDEDKLAAVFGTVASRGFDLTVLVMDLPHGRRCDRAAWEPTLSALRRAAREIGRPVALLTTLSDCMPEDLASALVADGITPLCGLAEGLGAVALAASREVAAEWRPLAPCGDGPVVQLNEAQGKAYLRGLGVKVPGVMDHAGQEAGPFAVKGLGLAHKSEAGAVRLGVARADVAAVMAKMPGPEGHLVEQMVEGGLAELLLAVRRDAVCGASLTIGMGGTQAELLGDTQTLILPIDGDGVCAALGRLRLAPLLAGYRGSSPIDLAPVVDVALRLAAAMETDQTVMEIEINPLILRATDAVAADVLMAVKETP